MIKALRPDDILVIKSIDRLGRNYDAIRKEFSKLTDRGVIIHVLDMPILNTDQTMAPGLTGKFIADIVLNILGFVAEQERDNIRQRQSEGIRAAKLAGKRFGRPSKKSKDFNKISDSVKVGNLTVIQACQVLGISRKTYYNHLNGSR
jgi:DNA invertase Pin-like site-specific DNA recombinase